MAATIGAMGVGIAVFIVFGPWNFTTRPDLRPVVDAIVAMRDAFAA